MCDANGEWMRDVDGDFIADVDGDVGGEWTVLCVEVGAYLIFGVLTCKRRFGVDCTRYCKIH